jgi:hypothetical protein
VETSGNPVDTELVSDWAELDSSANGYVLVDGMADLSS